MQSKLNADATTKKKLDNIKTCWMGGTAEQCGDTTAVWSHTDDAAKDFGCKVADVAFNYYTEDDVDKIYELLNSGKATKTAYDKDLPFYEFYKH
jgi:hypothetical protein